MNTFSTSPTMTLNMVRYAPTEAAAATQARATLRALKAEQRRSRVRRSPRAELARRWTVSAPLSSPARPSTAR